jgi:hypothetical protein
MRRSQTQVRRPSPHPCQRPRAALRTRSTLALRLTEIDVEPLRASGVGLRLRAARTGRAAPGGSGPAQRVELARGGLRLRRDQGGWNRRGCTAPSTTVSNAFARREQREMTRLEANANLCFSCFSKVSCVFKCFCWVAASAWQRAAWQKFLRLDLAATNPGQCPVAVAPPSTLALRTRPFNKPSLVARPRGCTLFRNEQSPRSAN